MSYPLIILVMGAIVIIPIVLYLQARPKQTYDIFEKETFILSAVAQGNRHNPEIQKFIGMYNQIVAARELPYLLVDATSPGVVVPQSRVKDGKIVFDLSPGALLTFKWCDDAVKLWMSVAGKPFEANLPFQSLRFLYSKKTGNGCELNLSTEPTASTQ
jgi:stringent starvation protein B